MCVCVCLRVTLFVYLKLPATGALWGQHAGVEGAVDSISDARLQLGLNLRHTN